MPLYSVFAYGDRQILTGLIMIRKTAIFSRQNPMLYSTTVVYDNCFKTNH